MPPKNQPLKNNKEQKAIKEANEIKDNIPEEVKKQYRMEARGLSHKIIEEEKSLAFYQ